MATTTFLSNATVMIGAVDFSDQVQSVTLTTGFDQLDDYRTRSPYFGALIVDLLF